MARARRLCLVLPPSEGKAADGDGPGWQPDHGAFGELLEERRRAVVAALAAAGGGTSKMLGVSGRHLERALGANLGLIGSPTLPAWRRYTGVVWEHLDPATLAAADRRRLVIVSGLLGLIGGEDPIPDYRLKIGASLPPLGKLSTWWSPAVSLAIAERARRDVIVEMLANEQRAAYTAPAGGNGLTVALLERSGAAGGHAAKAAKGRLARYLLDDRRLSTTGVTLDDVIAALADWRDDRFVVDITRW